MHVPKTGFRRFTKQVARTVVLVKGWRILYVIWHYTWYPNYKFTH